MTGATGRRYVPGRGQTVALGSLLVLAVAATVPIRRLIDRATDGFGASADPPYVTSGETLRRFSLGYEGLLADVYWTRAVQYFGRRRAGGATQFQLFGPLLRVATTLDPHLLVAYRFGAVFLAGKPPDGAGQPQQAIDLLRRGIVANPAYWRLWQDLGFVYYWDLHDYGGAARAFEAGSRMPGAAIWMKTTAAAIAAKGGGFETSRTLWSQIYREAENESIRRSAFEHLRALRAQEDIRHLDGLLANYQVREGHSPEALSDLVQAGMLQGIPVDPSRAPYVIKAGHAALGVGSSINLDLVR